MGVVVLQFFNTANVNPAVTPGRDVMASNAPPPQVAALLKNACYDCHSYLTEWPWYSNVAPVSWWVAGHVNDAREAVNFSDWPHDDPSHARKRWRRVADVVDSGEMPLRSYTWIHRAARLTADQRQQLTQWAEEAARK